MPCFIVLVGAYPRSVEERIKYSTGLPNTAALNVSNDGVDATRGASKILQYGTTKHLYLAAAYYQVRQSYLLIIYHRWLGVADMLLVRKDSTDRRYSSSNMHYSSVPLERPELLE